MADGLIVNQTGAGSVPVVCATLHMLRWETGNPLACKASRSQFDSDT